MPDFKRLAFWRSPHVERVLSPRYRRAVSVGVLAVAPAVFYAFVVKPYVSSVRRAMDALRSEAILLDREQAVTRRQRVIGDEASDAAAVARRIARRTYAAADSALTMSTFGRDVTTALNDAGLTVQRVEVRDSLSANAALRELTIDVRAQGDFESVLGALTRLEKSTRLIRVDRLAIDKNGERQASGGELLSLVAIIHGYAQ
jgi:type II secretory pathway component PulM